MHFSHPYSMQVIIIILSILFALFLFRKKGKAELRMNLRVHIVGDFDFLSPRSHYNLNTHSSNFNKNLLFKKKKHCLCVC